MHLVCGEALFDIFVDEKQSGCDVALRGVAGGSPYNVAIGLARLGTEVALGSDIAQDAFGGLLIDQLARAGVDQRFLHRAVAATPLAIVSLSEAGAPSYSFHGLRRGAFYPETTALKAHEGAISGIHLASIALVLAQSGDQLFALAQGMNKHALVSLDPNVRLSVEPDVRIWHRAIERVRPFVHLIKISEEDIRALYGRTLQPEELCESWVSDKTPLVILTKGDAGAVIFSGLAGRIDLDPINVELVDTVGAGDSFMAAFLSELVREGGLAQSSTAVQERDLLSRVGAFAVAAAALTCVAHGPAMPSRADVETMLVHNSAHAQR